MAVFHARVDFHAVLQWNAKNIFNSAYFIIVRNKKILNTKTGKN